MMKLKGHIARQMPTLDRCSSVVDRLATHAAPQPNGCILWTGPVGKHGYGIFDIDMGRTVHRVVWATVNGPIPRGHHVHHICEQKLCIRPSHLELLTLSEHRAEHNRLRALAQ